MQELAQKLIEMPFDRARKYTRRLDPDAQVQMWRQGIGEVLVTKYRLPNLGAVITLVEEDHVEPIRKNSDKLRFEPRFIEARVEPLE